MKKAKQPILYTVFALSSVGLEYLVIFLLQLLFGARLGDWPCKIIARGISSFYNFNANYHFVYEKDETYGRSILKYYCLAIPMMILSAVLLGLLARWIGIDQITAGMGKVQSAVLHTLLNAPVDIVIVIANFLIQKYWVFVKKK